MKNWIDTQSENEDIVLSSRIRLARNIKNIPFPNKLSEEKGKYVVKNIEEAFYSSPQIEEKFKTIHLWENDRVSNESYLDKHLISRGLINNSQVSAFILDKDETVSVMMNEEDHLRMQVITGGLNFKEGFDYINRLDDLLEEKLDYAFDEKLGYLTSCPTNLGTGLRASAMIHLPVLTANREIVGISNAITQVGMTIRGLYGEGSKGEGNLYQISNQVTLGLSEEEILTNLKGVINQVITQEKLARERMISKNKYQIEDRVHRSVGILKSAIILSTKEAINLLSNVRLGLEMGIIKDVDKKVLNKLLVDIQPAILEKTVENNMSNNERKLIRAKLVRERLQSMEL